MVALTQSGEVAGYVFARRAADEAEILNLAVLAAHARRGVGTGLVDAVLGDLVDAGIVRVFLEVRESNAGARAFYDRLGFRPVGRRRGYYSKPREDAVVLAYEIRGSKRRA
jgi:ribosomal-protein-alanine N-acetyltransferase